MLQSSRVYKNDGAYLFNNLLEKNMYKESKKARFEVKTTEFKFKRTSRQLKSF